MTPTQKRIRAVLAGSVFSSYKDVARATGLHVSTIYRSLNENQDLYISYLACKRRAMAIRRQNNVDRVEALRDRGMNVDDACYAAGISITHYEKCKSELRNRFDNLQL